MGSELVHVEATAILQTLGVLLGSYLVGAVPFGYLVARWRGVDILRQGSGNIGATNIGRVLGRRFGILVFLLDFAKGAGPVAAATWIAGQGGAAAGGFFDPEGLRVGAGLAAFLGHLFPVYLRFRGGKGVATGAGVVVVLVPWPALAAIVTWLTVLSATRYMSVASVAAVTALCAVRLAGAAAPEVALTLAGGLTAEPFAPENGTLTGFCFVAAALVALRHRANIGRLRRGTENRFQDTPKMLLVSKVIHVLALGLWFGSVVFFILAALVIFHTFEGLASPDGRPSWLPLPNDLTPEQASRLAGVAVGPLFDWYFALQAVCGFLTVITALAWSWANPSSTVHRVRAIVLILALASVLAGWPVARHVGTLRTERYLVEAEVAAGKAQAAAAEEAKANFGRWHGYSLLINFVTLGLVTLGMAMAAALPGSGPQGSGKQGSGVGGVEAGQASAATGSVKLPVGDS